MAEFGLSLFLSVLFLLLFVTTRVYCCGISTHIDIAHQAINWFKDARNGTDYREIILKHQDAFIAGNPYPDSMYPSFCYSGKFHSIAEDTHWSPFLNATVNYIRKKYPKPWDQVSVTNKDMTMMTMMTMMMLIRAMEFYFVDNGYVWKSWENSDCYDLDDDYSGTSLKYNLFITMK